VIYDNYYITTSKRRHLRTRHLKCQRNNIRKVWRFQYNGDEKKTKQWSTNCYTEN